MLLFNKSNFFFNLSANRKFNYALHIRSNTKFTHRALKNRRYLNSDVTFFNIDRR